MTSLQDEDEDDYMSASFLETAEAKQSKPKGETSLQRTARLKRAARDAGRRLSKAELAEREKAELEAGLMKEIPSSNKGAQMLAKMGYKGGSLGKSDNGIKEPVGVELKHNRSGIGLEAEKKRKWMAEAESVSKQRKIATDEFVANKRAERIEKEAENSTWSAMKILENLEDEGEGVEAQSSKSKHVPLRSINVLYRRLVKQRLEKEKNKMKDKLQSSSLSKLVRYDDPLADDYDEYLNSDEDDLEEEDPELDEFESANFVDRLEKITAHLRENYRYCFWCGIRYPDESMDGCPGSSKEDHDED